MRAAVLLLVLAAPALAAPNASLEKAVKLVSELDFTPAGKALDAALKQPGNDRPTLLKILELQAIVQATLGQTEKATAAFEQLLSLEPDFKLTGNHPPRVTTAFYEARGFIAANGRLEVRPLEAVVEPGGVRQLQVELTRDPLKLVKAVRFHLVERGVTTDVAGVISGVVASAAPPAGRGVVAWWAELLGERDAVLVELGSATALRVETAPPKPADAPVAAAEPVPPPAVETEAPSAPLSGKRIAAIGVLAGALACLGTGIAFGVVANNTRASVDAAGTNAAGQVTGLTQKQAFDLDATQRTQATLANVFVISGAVLAVGGGALFLLGDSSSEGSVAIVPAGAGVAITGTFR